MTIKRVPFRPNSILEGFMEEKKGTPITAEDIAKLQGTQNQVVEVVDRPPAVIKGEEKVLGIDKFHAEMQEQGRFVLPYLKLVQAMSDDFTQDNIPPGHFRNSLTGEDLGNVVEIAPIVVLHWRRFFEDRVVMCSSNDSVIGYGDPGGECKICPLQKWHVIRVTGQEEPVQNPRAFRAKKDEQMVAPLCSEQFVFPCMIFSSDLGIPGALVFHKTYLQEGLRFYSMAYFGPEDQVYRLASNKTTNDKGTWFVPKITMLRKMTETEKEARARYKGNMKTAIVDVDIQEDSGE